MELDFKPYIRLAMYHTWLYDYFADRSLYDHEIIFIDKGMMKIEFDDETCFVKKDDAVFIRPNEHHKITWYETNCCQPHVHFDFNKDELSPIIPVSMKRKDHMREVELTYFREDYLKQHGINLPHVIHLKNPSVVRDIILKIIDVYTFDSPIKEFYLEGLLKVLIAHLIEESSNVKEEKQSDTLSLLVRYMAENLDANLTLRDFELKTNLTSWTLNQLFRKTYKTTPKKYYDQLRLNYAKNLVRYSFKTVKEISELLNFDQPQTFSRWFHHLDGRYPTEYKKVKTVKIKSSY